MKKSYLAPFVSVVIGLAAATYTSNQTYSRALAAAENSQQQTSLLEKKVESFVAEKKPEIIYSPQVYTIKKGDTLWKIHQQTSVPFEALMYANRDSGYNLDRPKTGDKVVIPQVVNNYRVSADGIKFIKFEEGFSPIVYPDDGVPAWGYGHRQKGNEKIPQHSITEDEASSILANDLADVEKTIKWYVTFPLTQNQYDALASFVFNAGGGRFIREVLPSINTGNFDKMLKYTNGGKLKARREREREWINGRKVFKK